MPYIKRTENDNVITFNTSLWNELLFIVQLFYFLQVGEITTDLGKHQHMHDRDDLQAEQVGWVSETFFLFVKYVTNLIACFGLNPLSVI